MNAKRILALLGVIILVGLYIATLIFAVMGNGHFKEMFAASLAATVAIPIMIHLFLMMKNVKNGKSVMDNPYSYRDKDNYSDDKK